MLAQAGEPCLDDAGVAPDAVDHLYVSNMASGEFEGQTGIPNALAHDLSALPAYTARIDQTSSSGGAGIYAAWQSVASGALEMTLLVGGEKMTHRTTGKPRTLSPRSPIPPSTNTASRCPRLRV